VKYQYETKPVNPELVTREFNIRRLDSTELKDFFQEYGYLLRQWPLTEWDLQALSLAAYYFNPELQVAIAQHKVKIAQEQTAGQRINPDVNIPLEHHSDTSDDRSPWLIGLLFKLVLEREGKRQARLDKAEAEKQVTRINIQSVAWKTYSHLKRRYIDYYSTVQDEELTRVQADIMEDILKILERRQELGQSSEFEVSATRLELQRVRLTLTSKQSAIVDAYNALAGAIGIPVEALENIKFLFADIDKLADNNELLQKDLQGLALQHRLDIQKALQEYAVYEASLRLEIEKQYPDITLSPGFVFDQDDKIWALGAAWVLPLFHPQNEGPVREALALREVKQAEFLALQSRVINEISAAFASLSVQTVALQQAEALLQELRDRENQTLRQYELGYVDHLQLKRSNFETASLEQALSVISLSVIKAASQLEDAIQYPLTDQSFYNYIFKG